MYVCNKRLSTVGQVHEGYIETERQAQAMNSEESGRIATSGDGQVKVVDEVGW